MLRKVGSKLPINIMALHNLLTNWIERNQIVFEGSCVEAVDLLLIKCNIFPSLWSLV